MTLTSPVVTGAVLCALSLSLAPADAGSFAQSSDETPRMSTPGESELRAFAAANRRVEALQRSLNELLAEAETERQARRLHAQAEHAMHAAVRRAGLTVAEYNAIAETVVTHPPTAHRLEIYRSQASR